MRLNPSVIDVPGLEENVRDISKQRSLSTKYPEGVSLQKAKGPSTMSESYHGLIRGHEGVVAE